MTEDGWGGAVAGEDGAHVLLARVPGHGLVVHPCGSRSDGSSMVTVVQLWRKRLSKRPAAEDQAVGYQGGSFVGSHIWGIPGVSDLV